MVKHFSHHTQNDSQLLEAIAKNFRGATIAINGEDGEPPLISIVPIIFRPEIGEHGQIDFHLSKKNAMVERLLKGGAKATITILGPNCHISPGWYDKRFPNKDSDRSETAPTYNYVSATMKGTIAPMEPAGLIGHLTRQVKENEATAGENRWSLKEIKPAILVDKDKGWPTGIVGFSMPIEQLDVTTKISHTPSRPNEPDANVSGIVKGLRERKAYGDEAMATIMESDRGTIASLIEGLNAVGLVSKSVLPESKKVAGMGGR